MKRPCPVGNVLALQVTWSLKRPRREGDGLYLLFESLENQNDQVILIYSKALSIKPYYISAILQRE